MARALSLHTAYQTSTTEDGRATTDHNIACHSHSAFALYDFQSTKLNTKFGTKTQSEIKHKMPEHNNLNNTLSCVGHAPFRLALKIDVLKNNSWEL